MSIQIHLRHRILHLLNQKTQLYSQHLLQIHAQLIATGFHVDQSSPLILLQLCASNPSVLDHATFIFDRIHQSNITYWHGIIRQHASSSNPHQALLIFRNMQGRREDSLVFCEPHIYASVIKACGRIMAIREGKSVHCHVVRFGLDSNVSIQNTLIHFYSNLLNSLRVACNLFDRIPLRTIVTYNCMISGFLKNKLVYSGLSLFNQVLGSSIETELRPNDVTLVILISGCTKLGNLAIGKSLHSYCCKAIMGSSNSVCNALIDLYGEFECMNDASRLFEEMPQRDLVSWNTMIAGYGKSNDSYKALMLFREMRCRDLEVDEVTLVNLISACARSKDLDMGKRVHAYLKKQGIVTTVTTTTALINMYSKCGAIEIARKVFDEVPIRNIVSWNSMISGYVGCEYFTEALSLFNLIQSRNLKPDEVTMLGLISACRNSGALNHGQRIHSYIENSGLDGKTVLCNAIIDMYAKCGSMNKAKRVFDKMSERDVISWTSTIIGYAFNGQGEEALCTFRKMRATRVEPNRITFIGVLSACDHAGLVEDGRNFYEIMYKEYGIEPEIEHCGCMVDMFARAGLLEEAYEFVKSMRVEPNAVVWRMLIGGCRTHGDVDLGLNSVDALLRLELICDAEDFVISSNVFAAAGRWEEAMLSRKFMTDQKIVKIPGISSVSDGSSE